MKRIFINNILFRVVAPAIYGTMLYIIVLLVFDSIILLYDNFFSEEVLLCILITYLLSESMRAAILLLDRFYPFEKNSTIRILLQTSISCILSIIFVSLIIYFYFKLIIGYSHFYTELIAFNIVFLISCLFYNLLFFSIFFLDKQSNIQLIKEQTKRKNSEYKLKAFINEINPNFLFASLETLITIIRNEPKSSDDFINRLSRIYRYKLDNKFNELIDLKSEINSVEDLIFILNLRNNNNILVNFNIPEKYFNKNILPNTLNRIFENIVNNNIISNLQSFKVNCEINSKSFLLITYMENPILRNFEDAENQFEIIVSSYKYFTNRSLSKTVENKKCLIKIPLLEIEREI
ncbi:MAG: histidine kinase [Bacteroidales bacterium]|nr:histidine kinase [Bacteroidales bacterium]